MENKKIFLIIFTLIFLNNIIFADDMLYYLKAFSFIQNNEYVKEKYKSLLIVKPDSIVVFVSADVLSFSPDLFIDEIIKYEFQQCLRLNMYNVIKDYLELIPSASVKEKNKDMLLLNKIETGNVLIFFSKVVGNKLIAELKVYDDHYPPDYNFFSGYPSGNIIQMLFYFSDDGEIEKVFYKYTSG